MPIWGDKVRLLRAPLPCAKGVQHDPPQLNVGQSRNRALVSAGLRTVVGNALDWSAPDIIRHFGAQKIARPTAL